MVITLSIETDKPEQTVDPDKMQQNVASDQGLHCLHSSTTSSICSDTSADSKMDLPYTT